MKIAIVGTGGVGGYFGGKLAKAGNEVTFLARGEHLNSIKNKGLLVNSINGNFIIDPCKVTEHISEIENAELIIVAVKAWQVKEVAKELKAIVSENTMVLPLQNGVLATQELQTELGESKVLGGLCRILSKIESPGVISHFGIKPEIVFGEIDNIETERVLLLNKILNEAGIEARISKDITADLWKKFIGICVSGLLAVTKTTYGELRELPQTRQMMTGLIQEIFELSQKMKVKIKEDFVERTIKFIDTFPYKSTSSLTRDVWAGKPSEIEYQNGTVVKLAENIDFNTPINKFVYFSILPMEIKARKG